MEQFFTEYFESHKNIQRLLDNISLLHDKPDEVTDLSDHTSLRILKKFRAPITSYYKSLIEEFCREKSKFEYDVLSNMEFYIRFYFPRSELIDINKKKSKHIVVMFNGLDESLMQHFALYDRIASSFNSMGLIAVLLPTPFHLNRAAHLISEIEGKSPVKNRPTVKSPSSKLKEQPFLLFVNFEQTLYEFHLLSLLIMRKFEEIQSVNKDNFILEIKKPTEHDVTFYNRYFDCEDIKISLLGYSFGALKALMCLKKYPDYIKKCILFGGGGTIQNFKLEPMMSDKDWQKIIERISPTVGLGPRSEDMRESNEFERCPDKRLISNILFGEKNVLSPDDTKKLILVAGAKDKVISPDSLKRLDVEEHGLTIIQIADLSHFLVDDPHFHIWYSRIMNLIGDFFKDPEGKLVTRKECLETMLIFNFFSKNAFANAVKEQTQKSFEEIFSKTLYKSLIGLTDEETAIKIREYFNSVYRVSKAYIVSDEDLIRRLQKLRNGNDLLFGQIVAKNIGGSFEDIDKLLKDKPSSELSGEVLVRKGHIDEKNIPHLLDNQIKKYKLDLMVADWDTLQVLYQNGKKLLVGSNKILI